MEVAGASPRNLGAARSGRPTARRRGTDFSESERFVLKRCKDMLLRRHSTLQNAFKRLDLNHNRGLCLVEFLEATRSLLRQVDAQILFRLLDNSCDQVVTVSELQSVLEDV